MASSQKDELGSRPPAPNHRPTESSSGRVPDSCRPLTSAPGYDRLNLLLIRINSREAQCVGCTRKVSSKDVAREAGVSQATVSYVLNDTEGVKISPQTREAVLAAAKRLNYHPDQSARAMRLRKAMSIAVVSDKDVSSLRFISVLDGIKSVLAQRNYSLTLCFDRWQDSPSAEHVQYYQANRIDGAIFVWATVTDDHYAYLVDHGIPFAVIHSSLSVDPPNLVRSDLDPAILAAVTDLKQKGAATIGFLGRASHGANHGASDRRYSGFVRALAQLGLDEPSSPPLRRLAGDLDEDIAASLDEHIRDHSRLPQAILCETVNIGFRVLRYAARRGIVVPRDLSVVAIGSSRFAPLSVPALSTIEGPLFEMGARACEVLFDAIEGRVPQTPVVLEWSYVPRESS